jgi:hypothetical protein
MGVIELDAQTAKDKLHKQPFMFRHDLADHPLFQLPRLAQLATELPRDCVEFNGSDIEPGQALETIPKLDMDADQLIKDIENQHAWVVLKHVHLIPEYRDVLKNYVESAFCAAGLKDQPYSDLQGFIFIASAKSTTPFHADAEENLLAHFRGKKFFHVWGNEDGDILNEEEQELSPAKNRIQHYDPEYEKKGEVYTLNPGDGLHVPYMNPHWVRTGDEYAISMQMSWKTTEVLRLNKIRLMNGTLRGLGLPQKPPGVSPTMDSAKIFAHDCARAIIDPLRKTESVRRVLRRVIYGKEANYYY